MYSSSAFYIKPDHNYDTYMCYDSMKTGKREVSKPEKFDVFLLSFFLAS